jgi:hypothetical protein
METTELSNPDLASWDRPRSSNEIQSFIASRHSALEMESEVFDLDEVLV